MDFYVLHTGQPNPARRKRQAQKKHLNSALLTKTSRTAYLFIFNYLLFTLNFPLLPACAKLPAGQRPGHAAACYFSE
jgi:hypothetical protein